MLQRKMMLMMMSCPKMRRARDIRCESDAIFAIIPEFTVIRAIITRWRYRRYARPSDDADVLMPI